MFTGLIETTGAVIDITPGAGATRITIAAPRLAARLNTGDSVAVNGVCLTALSIEPHAFPPRFSADLAAETIARTTLSQLRKESVVNLELPTPAGSPLGGHVVQGHVDGTARLLALDPVRPSRRRLRIGGSSLNCLLRLLSLWFRKGRLPWKGFRLLLRPYMGTWLRLRSFRILTRATNLHTLKVGAQVNIETDVLARYAERRQASEAFILTEQYLLANGY